eukprot:m.303899 g.303899  ORF g.303899 m.303899 type:complete len:294 (+) comp55259_c0_seq2:214-1095(+)
MSPVHRALGFCVLLLLLASASADVTATLANGTIVTYASLDANFGPTIETELTGVLAVAAPLHACAPIEAAPRNGSYVALIQRSSSSSTTESACTFLDKVTNAQQAGFAGVIVFDCYDEELVEMGGESSSIKIPSVFISMEAGTLLLNAPHPVQVVLTSSTDSWTTLSFNVLMALGVVVASAILLFLLICFLRRRYGIHPTYHPITPKVLAECDLEKLPVSKYVPVEGTETETCCICLVEYADQDLVTTLPCRHFFHQSCITPWLRERSRSCPFCKRDPLADEATPLLQIQTSA